MENNINMVYYFGQDILSSPKIKQLDQYKHHRTTTIYYHSLAVADLSLFYANFIEKWFNIHADRFSLVRGALLHDYFLYDWHTSSSKFHGIKHPKIAYENALKDFELNKIEANIIRRHMFPLTLIPPRYKESILICIADKWVAIKELTKKENIIYERI